MTENKRFTIKTVEEDCIFDNQDCKYYDELNMIIELLNELWEELVELTNKQIKSVDENEQLKSEIKDLNDVLARYEEKELKFRNCIGKSAQILTRSDWEDL